MEGSSVLEQSSLLVNGFIEEIDCSGIYGWAYNILRPSKHASLTLFIDDEQMASVNCQTYRSDVLNAGHPAAEVGFRFVIPQAFYDGRTHEFYVADEDGQKVSLGGYNSNRKEIWSFAMSVFLDVDFYALHYMGKETADGRSASEHWMQIGEALGFSPNLQALLDQHAAEGQILPADFDPDFYRFLNPDLRNALPHDWQLQLHYLGAGRREGRSYRLDKQEFFSALYLAGHRLDRSQIKELLRSPTIYTDMWDLLSRNGVTCDAFLGIFNISDYVAFNASDRFHTIVQCVRHFVETGIRQLAPIAAHCLFDPSFYKEIGNASRGDDDASLYLHWINHGLEKGIPPNRIEFLKGLGLTLTHDFPADFDHTLYLMLNPDLAHLEGRSRWDVLAHAVQHGLAEERKGCPLARSTSEIYRVAADRLAIGNRLDSARKLYEQTLAAFPNDTMALRHYGDCLLRLTEHYQASAVYERTIALGVDTVWTHLNVTTAYVSTSRWIEASHAMDLIAKRRRGDIGIQHHRQAIVKQAFEALSHEASWLAGNRFYTKARAQMHTACSSLTHLLETSPSARFHRDRPIRAVAIIADLGLPQCKFYRIDQKVEQLVEAGLSCDVFNYVSDVPAYVDRSDSFDALILYRVPAVPQVVDAIRVARNAGQPTLYEIDDLMFEEEIFPPSFSSYGGQISHDLYATLITGAVALKRALCLCDYAIASTSPLASAMAPHTRQNRAFVHRNALGSIHVRNMNPEERVQSQEIRIFYGSGTQAHNQDFETQLAPALARILERYGRGVKLVIMGYLTLPDTLLAYSESIVVISPIWDIEVYWGVLGDMDINLAVLEPGLVADCKSEIKWLEAAMLGIPSVVSRTATYDEVIRDGKTGILAASPEDWFDALDTLVRDGELRRRIGAQALLDVKERYAPGAMSGSILSILNEVCGVRPVENDRRRSRVLIVNVFFPPQSIGGATRVVADNVQDIVAAHGDKIEIEVFTGIEGSRDAYRVQTYRWNGVRVTGVATPDDPEIDARMSDDRIGSVFETVLDRFSPDLIHFHCIQRLTPTLCSVAAERGIPYLITLHDAWWISDKQFVIDEFGNGSFYAFDDPLEELRLGSDRSFKRMKTKQKGLNGARKLLAVSEAFAQVYRSNGFSNVQTIENGLSGNIEPVRVPSPDGRVRLAHVGGLNLYKGYNLVMAVLSRNAFPNLHLLVIDHSMEAGTERTARWGETEVLFRAKVSQGKVGELYGQIDVLLAPSFWPESYGLVTREALASGCWVVASDRGAIGSDVSAENGFVVSVDSDAELTRVLAEINRDPERFTRSPPTRPTLRSATQQAHELVTEYLAIVAPSRHPSPHGMLAS